MSTHLQEVVAMDIPTESAGWVGLAIAAIAQCIGIVWALGRAAAGIADNGERLDKVEAKQDRMDGQLRGFGETMARVDERTAFLVRNAGGIGKNPA